MASSKVLLICAVSILSLVASSGCGGPKGPQRHELSGTVTFNGKPVPLGYIMFAPDKTKGNEGPGASVDIRDGRYQTMSGQGPVGGPHVVTINGFDGVQKGVNKMGSRLFDEMRINIDLPKQNGTHDFVLPIGRARVNRKSK